MIVSIFNKAKVNIQNNWKSLSLILVLWFIISQYSDLYKHILEASQLANCISSDENIITPCKKLLELSGKLVFLFGLVTISILIFKEEKENIIKILFVYSSAVTVLYTTGIGYTDIEEQRLQLNLNKEYHTAAQENGLLVIYKTNQEKIKDDNEEKTKKFENSLKIKELETSINNREIFYKVLQEEAKIYLRYKVTASFAIIVLSYVLLLILLLQLRTDKLRIVGILIILLLLANPNY